MKQTMEQKRAAHAWLSAKGAKDTLNAPNIKDSFRDYVNAAKGLPALIMNSGLMQVMAYFNGKKEEERYGLLSSHLRDWLHQIHGTPNDFEGFMQRMLSAEPRDFQAITAEAFAWLRWLRQMAPAVQKED